MGDPAPRLFDALKRIASYDPPDILQRVSQKRYGLEPDEAIEFAYENVIQEAKNAIKGMRRPKTKATRAAAEIGKAIAPGAEGGM